MDKRIKVSQERVKIRFMTKEDIEKVCEIEREAFSLPWSEKSFSESLALPHAIFLVAQYEQEIIGYCGMYQIFCEGDITNIAVAKKYRGNGIGRLLMQKIIMKAEEKGILDITLEVRKSNDRAIALYESLGFNNVGVRKNFYENPREDGIVMWKNAESA